MKNNEKNPVQIPENATTNAFWKVISKLPFAKQAMAIASFAAVVGCGSKEEPVQTKDTTLPTVQITNLQQLDLDNDGHKDDATFTVTATDNVGVATGSIYANINGQAVAKTGENKFSATNLTVGENTIQAGAFDEAGNKGETETKITVEQNDETPPTLSVNTEVSDLDSTGHPNDIVIAVTATDPSGIKKTEVSVDGEIITLENGKYTKKNAATGTHNILVKTWDTKDNLAEKTDTAEVEALVTATASINLTTPDAIVDGAPAGTKIGTLNTTFTIDGTTKTLAELTNAGYTVDITSNNNQVAVQANGDIKTTVALDRDGANNTDPDNLKNLSATITITVAKNGVQKATATESFTNEKEDIQDFTNEYGHLIELEKDANGIGKTAPEYTNMVSNANSLSDIFALRTDVAIINNIVAAGGSRFTRTTYNIAGLDYSYLTIDGKRLRLRSMSWLLDAVSKCRLSSQTTHKLMTQDQQVAQKIADALKTLTFVPFNNPSEDPGGQIQIDSKLTAAKIGAGATVNYNIDNGNY